jgi:hypothetical protein
MAAASVSVTTYMLMKWRAGWPAASISNGGVAAVRRMR